MERRSDSDARLAAMPAPVLPAGLELIGPLGQGKMARVYLAREPELERLVVLKTLRPELSSDETARLRFEREARSAAALMHPHVVPVYRFGRLPDGTPFLVMAYVKGRTLADLIEAEGTMGERTALELLEHLASALAAAHKKGVVHRDVRPDNVLIDEETGTPLLSDFGLARVLEGGTDRGPRITRTGQIIGEPRYSAPEQLRGEKVTGQADIYSLGLLAYEVLTKEGPYRARTNADWITSHLTAEPIPITRLKPVISRPLEELLLKCLAREPSHRPRAEDLVRRLGAIRSGKAGDAPEGEGLGILRRRIPHVVGLAFAGGLTLLGIVDQLIDQDFLPRAAYPVTLNLAVFGLVGSGVIAWFHGERGKQEVTLTEKVILSVLGVLWLAATIVLLRR
jgi:serine/threonine protein kinase